MMPSWKHALLVPSFGFVFLALFAIPTTAQKFLTIDFPGATSTTPETINNVGQVVGSYTDGEGATHGFLLNTGVFTTIDFPTGTNTVAAGINNNGQIVGFYQDTKQLTHGFLLNNGSFTTIDDPAFPGGTFPAEISDPGLIVGVGVDAKGVHHGFTLSNKTFTTLDFPGANYSVITDLNYNGSEIVGAYSLPSFPQNTLAGFTYANGVFTTVNFPESSSTALNGVNNHGQTVGTFYPPETLNASVFLRTGNNFTVQDFPGAVSTGASDLNDLDEIVGIYIDQESVTHAYLETGGPFAYAPIRSTNSVAVFDVTTALQLPSIQVGAGPVGIGLSPNGTIAYVANYQGNSVSVINTASGAVIATIQVGNNPLGVAVTPNGAYAYIANNFSNSVSVINTDSNEVVATIPVGSIPSFDAVTPNGDFVYVTNQGSGTVSVISAATNTVVATVNTGSDPVGLAITPDGRFVYVVLPVAQSVAVISTATNTITTTIPVGGDPIRVSITPDGSVAYVSIESSNIAQVIDLSSNTIVASVTVGKIPYGSAVTPDGASNWVIDSGSNQLSIISTATNTVTATLPLSGGSDIAIAPAPGTSQQITQPLSPTAPNTFNFGTNSFGVQYPPGTTFSGVNMTVTAVEITEAQFSQRVAGTQFAGSTCIVYGGSGGNCVDYQVTCSNSSGSQIPCPSESTPTIAVQTSFTTIQPIVNPGFLTTPIGENDWTNIFTGLSDLIAKGRTKGFSEFVVVDLPVTNPQGKGNLSFLAPLRSTDRRVFGSGVPIPVGFHLTSTTTPSESITNAIANLTLEMVSNAAGQAQSNVILALQNAFKYQSSTGAYLYQINTTGFAPGTYALVVYGNSFAAQQVQFTINTRIPTTCLIQSSASSFYKGETITLTTTVQPATAGSITPTGRVTFMDAAFSVFELGSAALVGESASIKTVLSAPPERQWIDASYPGDNNYLPCTSRSIPEDYSPK